MEIIVTATFNDDDMDTINGFEKLLQAMGDKLYRLPVGVNATEISGLLEELADDVKQLKGMAGIESDDDDD